MTKIVVIILALVVALFAGCSTKKEPTTQRISGHSWYSEVKPDNQLIYEETYKELLKTAMSSDRPLSSEAVAFILAKYGFGLSDISTISGGRFSESDVTHGRFTPERAENALHTFDVLKEAYELNVKGYIMENGIEDGTTADEIIEWYRENQE